MTTAPDDPADWGVLPVTAEIEIDGVRHSYTEGVTALTWQAGGEDFRAHVRETVLDRLGAHLARTLPVTITEPPAPATTTREGTDQP